MKETDYKDEDGEQFWVENIRNGDARAFEILFKKYYEQLTRFAWGYVHSHAISEEMVQEVFTEIWESRKEWYIRESLRSYLYRAVRNRSLNHLNHLEIKRKYDPEWAEEYLQPEGTDISEEISEDKIKMIIGAALDELPERSKSAYKLHRHEGLTYKEISVVLGVSIKTVESNMTKTLRVLRKRLSKLLPFFIAVLLRM